MTKEEYLAELGDIGTKMSALQDAKIKARELFIAANAEFQPGDKVAVIWEPKSWFNNPIQERMEEAFISSVNDKWFNGEIKYEFKKIKKDGTMSWQSAGIYGYDKIELIEKAKPSTP